MLIPKKIKHRKWHKGRRHRIGIATRRLGVDFGSFGLKTLETGWITARQIEAARRAMTRFMKKGGKIWIRIFPDKPITTKGVEIPMGGGKGAVDHFVAPVKPGVIMFEIDGVAEDVAREALRLASHKMPVRTVIVSKDTV
ncbi:MAG: 50S ribosomal protein L16 [Parcubacteria group bacterium GW2011_GWC2_45_7]|nr:MAG: 50S ribosomal protein L16 [Parcubacteria group bacterium GW2011_GWC2_45_7]KKU73531.1 MAG: 50S ribosomal protein L16 [Parcubacteria group bacterium GW2011_GWA2_47_26]